MESLNVVFTSGEFSLEEFTDSLVDGSELRIYDSKRDYVLVESVKFKIKRVGFTPDDPRYLSFIDFCTKHRVKYNRSKKAVYTIKIKWLRKNGLDFTRGYSSCLSAQESKNSRSIMRESSKQFKDIFFGGGVF